MKVPSLVFAIGIVGSISGASANSAINLHANAPNFDCGLFYRMHSLPQTDPLDNVLKKLDAASASFRAVEADFEWDQYEKVINEVDDVQKGVIHYRRTGKEKDIEMKIDVKTEGDSENTQKPQPKFVLLSGGKLSVYWPPKRDQIKVIDLGQNASDFQSYLAIGFGSSGQDLLKAFDVTYSGPETISGVATAQLKLVPKSERIRSNFKEIILWIDLDRGISVQQKFTNPQGDSKLVKYSSIRMKDKLDDDIFKLKTTDKTQRL
jgi:outer membrane lipoprotein-sorting protein